MRGLPANIANHANIANEEKMIEGIGARRGDHEILERDERGSRVLGDGQGND